MRIWENILQYSKKKERKMYVQSPVLAEDGVIQDYLFQQLDQLVGKVSSHEGLDSDRYLLGILSLRQGCLHNLQAVKGCTKLKLGR